MIFLVLLSFLSITHPSHAAKPLCETYSILDEALNCEQSKTHQTTYLREYASYYCKKFNRYADKLSLNDPKQIFIRKTTVCLEKTLIKEYLNQSLFCENLEKIAYHSHQTCYRENGYCDLTFLDQIKVGNVVFGREVSKRPFFTAHQIWNIIKECKNE